MKIAILGAGGIGGYLAAKLTEAGTPVALIARGAHLEAIRTDGVTLIEPEGTTVARPAVLTDDPREIGTPDVLVVTVKAHQLAEALKAIAPAVGPDTLVVTVQNGVDAPDMAAEAFGAARVAICVARILSNITAPGEITRYGAPRSFTIGALEGGRRARRSRACAIPLPPPGSMCRTARTCWSTSGPSSCCSTPDRPSPQVRAPGSAPCATRPRSQPLRGG